MLTATASTIAEAVGGNIVAGPLTAAALGVTVDSRQVSPGTLFAALPGTNVDGHEHAVDAVERGARAVLISRDADAVAGLRQVAEARACAVIQVDDVLGALHRLASWHRGRLLATVVGITGSTGKTSTKDFLTNVLATTLRVTATAGNRNNEIGLPLTILTADGDTEVLVLEMGMRGRGQIAELAALARPDMGLITNVGTSHIELLGSQESIVQAKGELAAAVGERGVVFLNGDDVNSDPIRRMTAARVVTYGTSDLCDVRAAGIVLDARSKASFELVSPHGTVRVALDVPGRHNVYNACAAAAVALELGVTLGAVAEGLEKSALSTMRMELISTAGGVTVLNDAYNANPSSMRAAVETLAAMVAGNRRVAVLGDMGELGSFSELAHFQVGEEAGRAAIDVLVTVGERSVRIAEGARAAGMASESVRPCRTLDEAEEVLDDLLEPGDVVLVKASRMMGLERVVEGIVNPRVG